MENIKNLIDAVETLRGPNGCPWDKEQNHKSLKRYLLNEAYELLDAIDENNYEHICEELGDVLLQVVLHSQIASESKRFNIDDVAKVITDKLIRRHPHVFGDAKVKDSKEVIQNWEAIKSTEKPERTSVLDSIPNAAPALSRAEMISKKAVSVGFEWPEVSMLWDTFYSEIEEFKEVVTTNNPDRLTEEMGDMLFCLVNLSRWYKINPEFALNNTNKKFISRFKLMETTATKNLNEYSLEELEKLWNESKKVYR